MDWRHMYQQNGLRIFGSLRSHTHFLFFSKTMLNICRIMKKKISFKSNIVNDVFYLYGVLLSYTV